MNMYSDIIGALGEEWTVASAGGITGEAYVATTRQQKIFVKRNSSPFLAILSAEGIVPKLLWTKRMFNGDVLSAQQFIEGRELSPDDMKRSDVAAQLGKIHHSKELLFMLQQLNHTPVTSSLLLRQCAAYNQGESDVTIDEAVRWLEAHQPIDDERELVVCHSDLNHNNWIEGETGLLYLTDWDDAIIADRAFDLAMVVYSYVDEGDWETWFSHYGTRFTSELHDRMHWYAIAQTVLTLYGEQNDIARAEGLTVLRELLEEADERMQ
ncbi:phosphotransferase family protein [Exiguobacterium sp. AM39-5BH]|uniref:phosphotransferase family protein n=1 Tax=Exiguobacterium sp. AM39-5BH TaxID=2292355 RepID=UPI000FE239E0|nr:phosphotransferase family protein [Exiguobacterium sp. AM39-5BH]RHB51702.1 phosphotransferase [Exiguobacterium sp. AM39-5BH]